MKSDACFRNTEGHNGRESCSDHTPIRPVVQARGAVAIRALLPITELCQAFDRRFAPLQVKAIDELSFTCD
jgi:hypothetical protein